MWPCRVAPLAGLNHAAVSLLPHRTIEPLSLDAYKDYLTQIRPEPEQTRVPHAPPARSLLPTLAGLKVKDGQLPRAPQGFAQIGALIAAGRGGELVGDDVDDVTTHPEAATVRRSLPFDEPLRSATVT